MNFLASVRSRLPLRTLLVLGIGLGLIAAIVIGGSIDGAAFRAAASNARNDPAGLLLAIAAFATAFVLRSIAWRRVLPELSLGQSLAAIHVALGANHILPFRLGEPTRVLSAVRRDAVGIEAATASTVTLRAADMLSVVALGLIVGPAAFFNLLGVFGWICVAIMAAVAIAAWRWLASLASRRSDIVMPDALALAMSASAWLLEAVLVWQTAQWAGIDASWSAAVLVTTVAVAAQIAAFAPGGFGTYEAAAVAAWVTVGHDPADALVAALAAHALKTAYSFVTGAVAVFVPGPSLLGRFRLANVGRATPPEPINAAAPVVLFMPAFNEEEAVGACIERAPSHVFGHEVQVLIVDDGSTDATADVARAAGAEVLELGQNQGLGAAVRAGFQAGVERNAAVVVFCDADGEYPPEELANLVKPILTGQADYVGGSRFLGRIDHMRPHRRFGNIVLTKTLSVIARRKITDGQTGYRAFSLDAARSAEIIHDFNYAQVLTLDLLAKGYRYEEVPISYHFRKTGESFVKLGNYLRNVVPAVYRELNAA